MLQSFLDPETVAKQVFSDKPDDPDLLKFIDKSQLETTYGGTAPKVTQYWPPVMPDQNYTANEKELNMVSRSQYVSF